MRVVHVAPTIFGQEGLLGGGERYPLELARALARREVDCELVTFAPSQHRVIEDTSGLRVRVLRPWTFLRGHPAHPFTPDLARFVRNADIVHTHQLRSTPSRLAALAARWAPARLAVTDHGLGGGGWGGLLPRLFDAFLVVSRFSAATLGAPPERTRVIYGGTDTSRYSPDREAIRRGVLFVGRLTPHKGIDRLLRALPRTAELSIVGSKGHDPRPPESDYPQLLGRLASERNVRFLGPLSDDDLRAAYRRAAVLVLPSVTYTCYGRRVAISELLGLVALEAMASGTPVICSRIGGLPEIVEDGANGFLVEPGDVEALSDRLSLVLSDGGLAQRLGATARESVLQRFTWDACAQRCIAAYDELLRG